MCLIVTKAKTVVEVADHADLRKAHKLFEQVAPHVWPSLIGRFKVRKPLSKAQIKRLPAVLRSRVA